MKRPELIRLSPLGQLLRLPAALLAIGIVVLYVRVWGRESLGFIGGDGTGALALVIAYLVSIPLHEFLHVFAFRRFGRAPAGSTRINWVGLMAYSHCDVPMPISAYRASVALPGIVLGLIPVTIGFVSGNPWATVYGALLTASAIGDVRVLLALRGVPRGSTIQFVTERGGYEVVRQP
jgi:hypothetical protein